MESRSSPLSPQALLQHIKKDIKPESSQTYQCALLLQNLMSWKQIKTCLIVKFSHQKLYYHAHKLATKKLASLCHSPINFLYKKLVCSFLELPVMTSLPNHQFSKVISTWTPDHLLNISL